MTVSLTTRLGLTRWSSDADAWSREQIDANMGALEDLAVIGTQGTDAARPAAGVQRRLYLATDLERVYVDDGDEWYELLVAGVATAAQIVSTATGDVAATTVQAAIAELASEKATTAALTAHTGAAAGAHAATAISNTPAGGISATTVQAAINELDNEKAPKASPVFTGAPATTPAAATDLPTAITLVNYLRDRLLAVGLIA